MAQINGKTAVWTSPMAMVRTPKHWDVMTSMLD
jgi:hypothetical protein